LLIISFSRQFIKHCGRGQGAGEEGRREGGEEGKRERGKEGRREGGKKILSS